MKTDKHFSGQDRFSRWQSVRRFALVAAASVTIAMTQAACSSPEERADSYYESGARYLEQGDHVKARLEFQNALKLKEDHADSWYGMAKVEEKEQNWSLVAGDLMKALEINPKHLEARKSLIRLMLLAGAADQAKKHIDLAIEQSPDNLEIQVLKATALLRTDQGPEAVRIANEVLSKQPGNNDAVIVLAAERVENKDDAKALEIIDTAIANSKTPVPLYQFKLQMLERMNRQVEKIDVLRRLAELLPNDMNIRRTLAAHYMRSNDKEQADKEWRAVIAAMPDDPRAHLDYINYLRLSSGPDVAEKELRRLIEEKKDVWSFQSALVDLLVFQKRYDEAITLLDSIVAKDEESSRGVDARLKKSAIFILTKQYQDAEALISAALVKDEHNVEALRQKAEIRLIDGKLDEAIAILRQALNESPGNQMLRQMLGSVYERSGSIELADKEFSDGFRESRYSPDAGLAYARFLLRRSQLDRADALLTDISEAAPDNSSVLRMLADVKLQRQDWDGARALAEKIKAMGGESLLAEELAAATLAGQNRLSESIDVLLNARKMAPEQAQTKFALVRAYLKAGKADDARQFLEGIIEQEPDNVEALVLRGAVNLSTDAMDKARSDFNLAIEKAPKNSIGYRALADLEIRAGDLEKALAAVNAGLAAVPGNTDLSFSLAAIHERKSDYEAAIAVYESLLQADPGSLLAANNYASLISDHRTDKESIEKAAAAAAILRGSPVPQFKDTLGWILFLRGDVREARALLESAVQALPELSATNYHLGRLYLADGDLTRAKEKLEAALKFASSDTERQRADAALKELASTTPKSTTQQQ